MRRLKFCLYRKENILDYKDIRRINVLFKNQNGCQALGLKISYTDVKLLVPGPKSAFRWFKISKLWLFQGHSTFYKHDFFMVFHHNPNDSLSSPNIVFSFSRSVFTSSNPILSNNKFSPPSVNKRVTNSAVAKVCQDLENKIQLSAHSR